jgi:hypothetical protein
MLCHAALLFEWDAHPDKDRLKVPFRHGRPMMSIAYMPVRADMIALILNYGLKRNRHAGLSIQSP